MANLIRIKDTLDNLQPGTVEQQRIKNGFISYMNEQPALTPENLIPKIREDYPPHILFSSNALSESPAIYTILRDYIVANGATYSPHSSTNRVIYGLPATLYTDQRDIDMSHSLLNKALQAGTTSSSLRSNTSQYPGNASSAGNAKIAHNMATRFKAGAKFNGKLGEDLTEFIQNYLDAAKDYALTSEQKLSYFHHLFDGEAKRFYRLKVEGIASHFSEASAILQEEYNSLTRQNRVRKHLQQLRLNDIVSKKKCTVTEALEDLRETITKFTPQGPKSHRSEQSKVEYLYKAVVGAPWAKSALYASQSSNPQWDFQKLYTALDAAWLQEQEEEEARTRDGKFSSGKHDMKRNSISGKVPGLYFEGQGHYGRPRQPGSKSSAPFSSVNNRSNTSNTNDKIAGKNGLDRFGNARKCHNCESKDHFIRDCKSPKNLMRNVAQMLKSNPASTRKILFEVCQQAEEAIFDETYEDYEEFFIGDEHRTVSEDSNANKEEKRQDQVGTSLDIDPAEF